MKRLKTGRTTTPKLCEPVLHNYPPFLFPYNQNLLAFNLAVQNQSRDVSWMQHTITSIHPCKKRHVWRFPFCCAICSLLLTCQQFHSLRLLLTSRPSFSQKLNHCQRESLSKKNNVLATQKNSNKKVTELQSNNCNVFSQLSFISFRHSPAGKDLIQSAHLSLFTNYLLGAQQQRII